MESLDDKEKLRRLVIFLARNGMVSKAKMSQIMEMSLFDFLQEYGDGISDAIGEDLKSETSDSF